MDLSLSTNWNSRRARSAAEMVDQIRSVGLDAIELGYALTSDQADDIRKIVSQGGVSVTSVHNYCPVPPAVSTGHPEHFLFDADSESERRNAVQYTLHSLSLAKDTGAGAVVVHAARVKMKRTTEKLIALAQANKIGSRAWLKLFDRTLARREKRAYRHLDTLRRTLDSLLPHFEDAGIAIALENLPSWDAMPTESEMLRLCEDYKSPYLRYWHDIGHGKVRENLRFINHTYWAEKLLPYTAGIHIHDVVPPADDHLMPPLGNVDFSSLAFFSKAPLFRVLEPAPETPVQAVIDGIAHIRSAWSDLEAPSSGPPQK